MKLTLRVLFLLFFAMATTGLYASGEEGDEKSGGDTGHDEEVYDPVGTTLNHISDANEFHILGHFSIPLPIILFASGHGFTFGFSNMFDHGHTVVDGYVLNHGRVNRVIDDSFPKGHVHLEGEHPIEMSTQKVGNSIQDLGIISYEGKKFNLDKPSTWDGGLAGGGVTSFYDFSITKNVFTMLLAAILLIFIWGRIKRSYVKNEGQAPSGMQSLFEPVFVFIRDEVTKPMIGEKHYERFQPFIMCLFFFILFCNLFGLVPLFPGSANVTGNIAVTLGLALLVFLVTNLNGNKHYWGHIFNMPGVPKWVLIILTPVEILGLIIKPFSLMIRLFANITAGHIIILSLIGLVFVFGESGQNIGGGITGVIVGGAFTAFMNLIELLVAFLQAFIFAILTASYIGAAVEEHDHDDHEPASAS
jgi:F-type H+-transporting ATPase subunit a